AFLTIGLQPASGFAATVRGESLTCQTSLMRNPLHFTLLVTLLIAFSNSPSARAQSPKIHSISGVVLDQRTAPIPNAHVSLFDKAARLLLQTETGNDGRFTFPN